MKRSRALSPTSGLKLLKSIEGQIQGVHKLSTVREFDKENLHVNVEAKRPLSVLRGLVVEVEGNIGSGKSTLTEQLRCYVNDATADSETAVVFGEKVNNCFLASFYNSPKRFGFAFQMYMLTTRLYQMDEGARQAAEADRLVLLDRGAVGDTLFAVQNFKMGNMDAEEMRVYRSVCRERFPATLSDKVDVVMYLDVEPAECHRRMSALRKRDAEEGVPLSYLEGIDACYFYLFVNWLAARKDGLHDLNVGPAPPTLILRWNAFGNAHDVANALEDLAAGRRKSASVAFTREELVSSPDVALLATDEDVDAAYGRLRRADADGDTRGVRAAADAAIPTSVAIGWGLSHSNAFRRVTMAALAAGQRVIFFGPATDRPSELTLPLMEDPSS